MKRGFLLNQIQVLLLSMDKKTKNKEELQEMINQDKWDDIYKNIL